MIPTLEFGQAIIEERLRRHHGGPHRRLRSPLSREIGSHR